MEVRISKSDYKDFPVYYRSDLNQVVNFELHEGLSATLEKTVSLLTSERIIKLNKDYPPSHWIVKQHLENTIEAEKEILNNVIQASSISQERLDSKDILGRLAASDESSFGDALIDFKHVRSISIDLYQLLNEHELNQPAKYFDIEAPVFMGAFMIAAHTMGQLRVIKELYVKD